MDILRAADGFGAPFADNLSTSVQSVSSASQAGLSAALERRLDWLEEDIGVTQRRLRDTFGLGPGGGGKLYGMAGLQVMAVRVQTELEEERRWRGDMEAQIVELEETLTNERTNRGNSLQHLSLELDDTMKELVDRINSGVVEQSQVLGNRAARMEKALQILVSRVEMGLAVVSNGGSAIEPSVAIRLQSSQISRLGAIAGVGSMANEDYSGSASCSTTAASVAPMALARFPAATSSFAPTSSAALATPLSFVKSPGGGGSSPSVPLPSSAPSRRELVPATEATKLLQATEPLLQAWGELQDENSRLRERRQQLIVKHSEFPLGFMTAPSKEEAATRQAFAAVPESSSSSASTSRTFRPGLQSSQAMRRAPASESAQGYLFSTSRDLALDTSGMTRSESPAIIVAASSRGFCPSSGRVGACPLGGDATASSLAPGWQRTQRGLGGNGLVTHSHAIGRGQSLFRR